MNQQAKKVTLPENFRNLMRLPLLVNCISQKTDSVRMGTAVTLGSSDLSPLSTLLRYYALVDDCVRASRYNLMLRFGCRRD